MKEGNIQIINLVTLYINGSRQNTFGDDAAVVDKLKLMEKQFQQKNKIIGEMAEAVRDGKINIYS